MSIGILVNEIGNNDLTVAAVECLEKLRESGINGNLYYGGYADEGYFWAGGHCCLLPVVDIYRGRGTLVATCEETAKILDNARLKARKVFYPWDLEYVGKNQFDRYSALYNGRYEFYTRSESHRNCIIAAFGRDSEIIEDFNDEKLRRLGG